MKGSRPRLAGLVVLVGVSWVAVAGCSGGRKEGYSVPALIQMLKDKDPGMRYYATKSLGKLGPDAAAAVPDLIEALRDDDKSVRVGAAYALGDIGPAAAAAKPALERAAKDPDKKVRAAAAYALRRVQGRKK